MAITALPTPPSRSTPSTFSALADAFLGALPAFATEANAAAIAMNLNSVSSVSTTSLAVSVASKTLTVEASKSFLAGMSVKIARTASPSNWMVGDVTSYNAGSGELVVNVSHILGTGTFTDWTITQCAPVASVSVPLGFVSNVHIVKKDADELTISGFTIEIGGIAYTLGATTDKQVTSLSVSTWYYVFAEAPSGGTALSATEITYSSTAPTYDHAKCGWYDAGGTKRCFTCFYSDASSIVEDFSHDGLNYVLINGLEFLSTTSPATAWTAVDTLVPDLGSMLVRIIGTSTSGADSAGKTGYLRSTGQTNTDAHMIGGLSSSNSSGGVVYFPGAGTSSRPYKTDTSGQIDYYLATGYDLSAYKLKLLSFILPGGF